MAHVVVRAHRWTPDYLRTLPLHHSQQELESGEITLRGGFINDYLPLLSAYHPLPPIGDKAYQ